eukprot:GHRR01016321.1.p1 GENE.GHRR01016321.1~~GHRR01016321.1.p1  ORF type:complete len:352 (+),score=100.61 GHRR01016321.1:487-1542(+)
MAVASSTPATTSDLAPHCPMFMHTSSGDCKPAAACPLGFGSARGPQLSSLHCPVCKGLLFEPHMSTSCKHTFCHACISKTRDCPVCGQDVEGTEPNTVLEGLVNTFLDTHSRSPQLVAAQADLGPLPDNSPASFFMAQGLKSMAGGNLHAAVHRLSNARHELSTTVNAADSTQAPAASSEASIQQQQPEPMQSDLQQQQQLQGQTLADHGRIAKACQLAAICGSLGDCYGRLGNAAQAQQLYQDSISSVQQYSEDDAEAAHAMSVSLNKLGDLQYMQQNLQGARDLYNQCLVLRERCCGPLTQGQAGPSQQLELASSAVKVADVCKVNGLLLVVSLSATVLSMRCKWFVPL